MTDTTVKFLRWAEDYYGKYGDAVKVEVAKRLDYEVDRRGPLYVEALRQEVLNGYSNRYRTPPDVATLNEFSRAALNRWYDLKAKQPQKALPAVQYMDREELAKAIGEMLDGLVKKHKVSPSGGREE